MPYVAPKRRFDFLVLKCTTWFYHILVLLFKHFTIFLCNLSFSMVQLRMNFSNQQINAAFWYNIGQKILECSMQRKTKYFISNNILVYKTTFFARKLIRAWKNDTFSKWSWNETRMTYIGGGSYPKNIF